MERFIVGTGRCGSTLLSTMLTKHPALLVLSEFINGYRPVDFEGKAVSGSFFSDHLSQPNVMVDLTLHRGVVAPEILYGFAGKDLSALSCPQLFVAMLPLLSDKPEALLRESIEITRTFPTQTMGRHYLMYIEWLCSIFQKKLWVERTGASIEILPELVKMFPNAKFVHIHRDGLETALSMREHSFFRLYVSFFFNPPTRQELERTELAGKPIREDDPLTQRMTTHLPSYEQFGQFWSRQVEVGVPEFAKMGADQLLTVRFEDMVSNPVRLLEAIARFLELPDSPGWVESAAQLVAKIPKTRAHLLSDQDRAALERGCRSGQYLLGRARKWPIVDETIQLIKDVKAQHKAAAEVKP